MSQVFPNEKLSPPKVLLFVVLVSFSSTQNHFVKNHSFLTLEVTEDLLTQQFTWYFVTFQHNFIRQFCQFFVHMFGDLVEGLFLFCNFCRNLYIFSSVFFFNLRTHSQGNKKCVIWDGFAHLDTLLQIFYCEN